MSSLVNANVVASEGRRHRVRVLTSWCRRHGGEQGFDEYMNLVLEDAEELSMKKKSRKALGERLGGAGASLYLLT